MQILANQNTRNKAAIYLIERMLLGAREAVERKARDELKSLDDLHSTLLVYIAVPHDRDFMFLASAQVGDGAIRSLSRAPSGAQWTLQEQPQFNGIDNEVQPFMRFDPSRYGELIHITDLENPECAIGMTDGILDDIEGGPDENGLFKGIQDFYDRIRQQALATPKPADGLYEFLGYRRRASFDDRTLVCLYRDS